jgi:hypothetical protein
VFLKVIEFLDRPCSESECWSRSFAVGCLYCVGPVSVGEVVLCEVCCGELNWLHNLYSALDITRAIE